MRSQLLQEKLATGRMGSYHGAEAVAVYANVGDEFQVLRSGAGLLDLAWQARIACTGNDRVRWLNGMVTNNVRDLDRDRGVYAFVLNAQGHPQGDLTIYNRGEYLLIVTDHSQAPKLTEWFDRYIIMDDVELSDISAKLGAIGITGPESTNVLNKVGLPVPEQPLELKDAVWNAMGLSVVRGHNERFPSYEIWAAPENLAAIWTALVDGGATPAGYEALELHRIAIGNPSYGQDVRERELPQETGQDKALHFAKGCYIGQEIVERIRSRGNVHRVFTGFTLSEAAPQGMRLQRDGKDIGELTSVAELPLQDTRRIVALGYVRREASVPGTQLTAGGAIATVHTLPFEF